MALSFNPTDFSQKYGIVCFPILADLALYTLMRQVTTVTKSHFFSSFAGLSLIYVFAAHTSLISGWAGAGLYLPYKVGFYVLSSYLQITPSSLKLSRAMADLELSYDELQKDFIVTYHRSLDVKDLEFRIQLRSALEDMSPNIKFIKAKRGPVMYSTHQKTLSIVKQCQAILLRIYDELDKKTKELGHHRFPTMLRLLEDSSFNPDHVFGKALIILYRTYRSTVRHGYTISLPNLQNVDENCKKFLILEAYIDPPITTEQRDIETIFQEIDLKFRGLIATACTEKGFIEKKIGDAELLLDSYIKADPCCIMIPPVSVAAEQLGF